MSIVKLPVIVLVVPLNPPLTTLISVLEDCGPIVTPVEATLKFSVELTAPEGVEFMVTYV